MTTTFYIKSPRLISLFFSILMSFLVLCVLPLSFKVESEKLEQTQTLIQVYSAENNLEHKENKQVSENSFSLNPINYQQDVSKKMASIDLDFESVSSDMPNLSSGADFSIKAFSAATLSVEDSQIKLYDLASLDNIPKRLNNINIVYPRSMLNRGIEGKVLLNVILDEDGKLSVESVVSSTNKAFESPAIAGATKLRYSPPTKNGKIVKAKFVLPIPFTLK